MSRDLLSDVLRAVSFTGAVFFDVRACGPWVAEAPPAALVAGEVVPGAEEVMEFHVVTRGTCFGGLVDAPHERLEAGDVILFPHGDAHVMASAPGLRGPVRLDDFRRPPGVRLPIPVEMGPPHPSAPLDTHVLCGFLGWDARPFNPILGALPRVITARARDGWGENWLDLFVRAVDIEVQGGRPGSHSVITKLSELMFIDVVRRHLEHAGGESGWLAGLRDPQLSRALARIHEQPGADWILEELARVAAMSRSSFAERFTSVVGVAPMRYVTQWRMQTAAKMLGDGCTMGDAALSVGYRSEAAFQRAFKSVVGVTPGQWRSERRVRVGGAAARPP